MAFEWSDVGEYLGGTADIVAEVLNGDYGDAITKAGKMLAGDLGTEATPDAVMSALQNDPEAMVKVKEFEARNKSELINLQMKREEGWTDRYKAMCAADGHSTRPKIALICAWMLAIPYALIGFALARVIWANPELVKDLWPILLAYLMIPMGILNKYFGELRREHGQRNGIDGKGLLDRIKL